MQWLLPERDIAERRNKMAATVISSTLLNETRQRWLKEIVAVKYIMNGTTYTGQIQEKVVAGNAARFDIGITKRTGNGTDTITQVLLCKSDGSTVVTVNGPFTKRGTQGRYIRINLNLKEG